MELRLDDIATPQEESSPQLRYASLHRAVERGMASPEVYRELVETCLELGHVDEATRIHASMDECSTRDWIGSKLIRCGLLNEQEAASGTTDHDHHEDAPQQDPTVGEHIKDALQFLCQGHMPAVALLTMLAFPIIVGIGGFMTADGSPWLFAGLAALPGLCVLGVVGAMGRHTFLLAAEGAEAVPPIPAPTEMLQSARRHFTDSMLVMVVLIAPSLTLLWFEVPLTSSLPGLAAGMFLTPIALILRQSRGDLGAFSPIAMLRGIWRSRGYTKITLAFWLAFAPAAIAFWSSLGHAIWLQIAIVGPLAVLPTFATARLLGTFTEVHRWRLGTLLESAKGKVVRYSKPSTRTTSVARNRRTESSKPRVAAASPQARTTKSRSTQRTSNTSTRTQNGTKRRTRTGAGSQKTKVVRQAAQTTQSQPRKQRPSHAPAKAAARPQPAPRVAKSEPKPAASESPASSWTNEHDTGPDLSGIPGARVISSEDRERYGAASRRS